MIFYDLYNLYAAGRLILSGKDPYDLASIEVEMRAAGWPPHEAPNIFFYPPWSIYIFSILGLLPFRIVSILWSVSSILVFGRLGIDFIKREGLSRVGSLSRFHLVCIFLLFFPLFKHVFFGNSTFILLGVIYCSLLLLGNQRWFSAGIIFSLLFIKPHLLLPVEAAIGMYYLRERRISFFAGIVFGILVQSFIAFLIEPEIFHFYIAKRTPFADGQLYPTSSIVRIVGEMLGMPITFIQLSMGCALVIGLIQGIQGKASLRYVLTKGIPISLCMAPFSWSHDFILLLPAHLLLVDKLLRRLNVRIVILLSLVIFVISFLGVANPPLEQYLWPYPLFYLLGAMFIEQRELDTPQLAVACD